jgi:hypothetical protein
VPGRPLDRDDLLELFAELSAELHAEHTVDVIIAGGSFMALRQLRETTEDVDSVRRLAPRVRDAVARVAATRDLAPDWLNDHAVAFAPHGLKATDIVFESATLAVRLPRHDDIFLMKLAAAREQDRIDLIALWPFCSFGSAAAAVTAFHERIPMADDDPYLVEYVSEIIDAAEH